MNRNNDIPNRIKQPEKCCENCGKNYKKPADLKKHKLLCDLLQKSKDNRSVSTICLDNEEEETMPSQKILYKILIELTQKYNKLEQQMIEVNKWVYKNKKKFNVINWLNNNSVPNLTFDNFITTIIISQTEAIYIAEVSFYIAFNEIISRIIHEFKEDKIVPITAFSQKTNVFYVYEMMNGTKQWILLTKENLIRIFNKIHTKWIKVLYQWKKIKFAQLENNKDKLENTFDSANIKLMDIDFDKENVFSKTRTILFQCLKTDMKGLVEGDFEF